MWNGIFPIIEELKRQENDAMEVVCIDDGSADGSPAVLDAIDDPHFVVIHQANAGVAAARNHGLDVYVVSIYAS